MNNQTVHNDALAMPAPVRQAHRLGIYRRALVDRAQKCGCFHCLEIFDPEMISTWTDQGDTAPCPYYGIDAVLPDNPDFAVTQDFIKEMKYHWFGS